MKNILIEKEISEKLENGHIKTRIFTSLVGGQKIIYNLGKYLATYLHLNKKQIEEIKDNKEKYFEIK